MTRSMAEVPHVHVEKRREMCSKHRRVVRTERTRGDDYLRLRRQATTQDDGAIGLERTRGQWYSVLVTDGVVVTVFWLMISCALVVTYILRVI